MIVQRISFLKPWICKDKTIFFALLLVCLIGVYWYPLKHHPTLSFDDTALLEPLEKVDSIKSFIDLYTSGKVFDLQPVRDVSYLIELKMFELSGYRNSQLINLILWIFSLVFLHGLFQQLSVPKPFAYVILFAIATHPVVPNTIAWVSGRKHILSLFFLSYATWRYFKWGLTSVKNQIVLLACYLLLCFSQPINLLWAGALFLYELPKGGLQSLYKKSYFWFGLLTIGLFTIAVNLYYYSGEYQWQAGDFFPRYASDDRQNILIRFLIWGRAFYQIFFPISSSPIPHFILDERALIGFIPLIFFIVYSFLLIKKSTQFVVPVLLLIGPLLVTTFKVLSGYGADAYLLSSIWSLGLLLGLIFSQQKFSLAKQRVILYGMSFIGTLFLALSFEAASAWQSEQRLVTKAYEREPTAFALSMYAKYLVNTNKDWMIANETVNKLERVWPNDSNLPYLKAKLIYNADWSSQRKLQYYRDFEYQDPWYQYYFAVSEVQNQLYEEAYLRLEQVWNSDQLKVKRKFGKDIDQFLSNWKRICILAGYQNCSEKIPRSN